MKKHIVTSVLYTVITAVLLGIVYPLAVTGMAHVLFPKQANGSLIDRNGTLVGSERVRGVRVAEIMGKHPLAYQPNEPAEQNPGTDSKSRGARPGLTKWPAAPVAALTPPIRR